MLYVSKVNMFTLIIYVWYDIDILSNAFARMHASKFVVFFFFLGSICYIQPLVCQPCSQTGAVVGRLCWTPDNVTSPSRHPALSKACSDRSARFALIRDVHEIWQDVNVWLSETHVAGGISRELRAAGSVFPPLHLRGQNKACQVTHYCD